jgi:hypothetical protein
MHRKIDYLRNNINYEIKGLSNSFHDCPGGGERAEDTDNLFNKIYMPTVLLTLSKQIPQFFCVGLKANNTGNNAIAATFLGKIEIFIGGRDKGLRGEVVVYLRGDQAHTDRHMVGDL